jgi:DNA-binding NtrC family response regulator
MADHDILTGDDLRILDGEEGVPPTQLQGSEGRKAFHLDEVIPLDELEGRYVEWAATATGKDLPALAGRLGISVRTLYRKLRNHGSP